MIRHSTMQEFKSCDVEVALQSSKEARWRTGRPILHQNCALDSAGASCPKSNDTANLMRNQGSSYASIMAVGTCSEWFVHTMRNSALRLCTCQQGKHNAELRSTTCLCSTLACLQFASSSMQNVKVADKLWKGKICCPATAACQNVASACHNVRSLAVNVKQTASQDIYGGARRA